MIVLLCWAALLLKIPDDQNWFALFLFCKEDVGWVLCTGVYWDVYTSLLGQAVANVGALLVSMLFQQGEFRHGQ